MKTHTRGSLVLLAIISKVLCASSIEATSVNEYTGMQEREGVFEFTQKPVIKKEGEKWVISFASKGACDATVAIIGPDGKVIRHLASGVLGKNAPEPFKQGLLAQNIEWNGKDDDGKSAPPGCKAKVALGLDARFDKLETWALMANFRPLAIGKAGEVYAVGWGDAGTACWGLHVFGKNGKYIRTILPPPAILTAEGKITPERFALSSWNKTTNGEWVPRRNRSGGGYDFDLSKVPNLCTQLRSGTVTADGKLCLLYATPQAGAKLIILNANDGSCSENGIVDLGKIATDGMAASPDGKWLYFSGHKKHENDQFSHAVMRLSLEKPGKPEIFIGEAAKEGTDKTHFNGPNSVACDKDGNVYVGDSGNARIQIFKPDGTHFRTIPGIVGKLAGVSYKNGAIYIMYQESWTKNPKIIKLAGIENQTESGPAKAAELEITCGDQWRDGTSSALASNLADPPVILFAGNAFRGTAIVAGIEDRGNSLVRITDFLKANSTPNAGGDVTTSGQWASLYVNRRSGELSWNPVGPDGLVYSRGMFFLENKQCVFRMDPKTNRYVNFEYGEPAFKLQPVGGYEPLVQDGQPVIGLRMYHCRGSHLHQGPFCVAPNGDIYVGVTYSKETDAELEKAGLPRWDLKKPGISTPVLRVYDHDGRLKTPSALAGLMELEGLRVGRSGAVYVVQSWKPMGQKLPDGLAPGGSYEESRWGSLIKFTGNFEKFPVGRIEGSWESTPANPTHSSGNLKVKLQNAAWTYAGVSPHSGAYSSCSCLKASADLDDYERSFVCAAQTCTINVIDSNGNVVARLGGYGNVDSQGDNSPIKDPKTGEIRPRNPDDPKDLKSPIRPLGFSMPRNVAASDDFMWVVDLDDRALVKAALIYREEQIVPIP